MHIFNNKVHILATIYINYYSITQVLLALHEKGLPFVSKPVDMARGDQYKPWFLKLSPKGEVPILVYKGQVTSGSVRILNQLENIGAGKGRKIGKD